MLTVEFTIALAIKHVADSPVFESPARQCLDDAKTLFKNGNRNGAKRRAIDSLRYSVGVYHRAYQRANRW